MTVSIIITIRIRLRIIGNTPRSDKNLILFLCFNGKYSFYTHVTVSGSLLGSPYIKGYKVDRSVKYS